MRRGGLREKEREKLLKKTRPSEKAREALSGFYMSLVCLKIER